MQSFESNSRNIFSHHQLESATTLWSSGTVCQWQLSHHQHMMILDTTKRLAQKDLPSRRRLRDYKNYIRPERGFNNHIIDELK